VIYNIIIDSFGRWSQVEKMVLFYEEMMRLNLKPDAYTITSIIVGYAKIGDIANMERYVEILKQMFPNQPDQMVFSIQHRCHFDYSARYYDHSLRKERNAFHSY
jgi:pentatricopeptide repeat protein